MSDIIKAIQAHPRRALLYGAGISLSVVTLQLLWRKFFSPRTYEKKLPRLRYSTWKLSNKCEIDVSAFNAAIEGLENLLNELESQKFATDIGRGRYDLISSIIFRLKGICDDLQKYITDDFLKKTATEEIARTVWNEGARYMPKTGTLSVFSEDSFNTANDDYIYPRELDSTSVSFSIDFDNLKIYLEALKAVENGQVRYRKSRAEHCQCDSDKDFAAKVYCLRKVFRMIMNNEHRMHWLIQSGRQLIADLLRQDGKDPSGFYTAYDRMMEFLMHEENRPILMEELEARNVEEINLWDVLFDFVVLDAFDDLKKPPSTIVALVKNNWFSQSMKESTINNLIWSMIKAKKAKLHIKDGFISRFYDISQIITSSLTLGILGGNNSEFAEICTFFRENVFAFICEIFNVNRVRYTSYEDLAEDVEKLLIERIEIVKNKLSNEVLPIII